MTQAHTQAQRPGRDRRFLCVYLPLWAVNVVERRKEPNGKEAFLSKKLCMDEGHTPLILFRKTGNQQSVVRMCTCAARAGVREDMALSLAEAVAPSGTRFLPHDAAEDFKLLYRLARWAMKFTPLVAIDTELVAAYKRHELSSTSALAWGMTLDITGTERVHRGEFAIAERLRAALEGRGVTIKMGIGPTVSAAWALSRFGESELNILTGTIEEGLSSFPLSALRLNAGTQTLLSQLGIHTVGLLLSLPRASLGSRFKDPSGFEGVLTRIAQLFGTQEEPLHYLRPRTHVQAGRHFDIPLTNHLSLKITILQLLEKVFTLLEREGRHTRSLIIEITYRNFDRSLRTLRKELTLCHATRSLAHAQQVIEPLVESVRAYEGVSDVQVLAKLVTRSTPHQRALTGSEAALQDEIELPAKELLNHLVVRLGKERVTKILMKESHLPERAFQYVPVGSLDEVERASPRVPYLNRPSYLLEPPQPISAIAMLPDKPPSRLQWQGERFTIVFGEGPERICQEWWEDSVTESCATMSGAPKARDYFRVQEEKGRWLWVFRESESQRWFVHGIWV